jgi:hypothetical protein
MPSAVGKSGQDKAQNRKTARILLFGGPKSC